MTNQNQPPSQNSENDDLNRGTLLPYIALAKLRKEAGLEDQAEFFCPAKEK
jgi:hypothetical protein